MKQEPHQPSDPNAKKDSEKKGPSAIGRFARGFATLITGQSDGKSKAEKKAEKLARMTASAEKAQQAAAEKATKRKTGQTGKSEDKKKPLITAQQYSRQKEVNKPKPTVEGISIPATQTVQTLAPKPELDPRVVDAIESIKTFTQTRIEKEKELLSAIADTKACVSQSADNMNQTVTQVTQQVTQEVSQEMDKQLNQSVDQISTRVEATVDSLSEEVKTFRTDTIQSMQAQLDEARRSSRHGWQAAMAASFIGVVSLTFSLIFAGGSGIDPEDLHQQLATQRGQYQLQIDAKVELIDNQAQQLSVLEQELKDNSQALEAANRAMDQMLAAAEARPSGTLTVNSAAPHLSGDPAPSVSSTDSSNDGPSEASDSALSSVE